MRDGPWVETVEVDRLMQLHLSESVRLINKHLLASRFDRPHSDFDGSGTAVMIIDSGVDFRREDLGRCSSAGANCKVVFARDFTPVDDGDPDNGSFHGSNVAAVAAGKRGVARGAKIISADIMDHNGRIRTSYVVDAINWAVSNRDTYNIVAINMSLGGGPQVPAGCYTSPYAPAIFEARRSGMVVVSSSGNDDNPQGMGEPACVPHVVSVGAVYDGGTVSPDTCPPPHPAGGVTCFSNASAITTTLAPGAEIVAADITMSGTSQASPHVAGAVAVLKSLEPSLSVTEIEERIRKTGIPVDDSRNGMTYSRLDLVGLLEGNLDRPEPVDAAYEWLRPNEIDGNRLPVLNDPWLVQHSVREELVVDKASGLTWVKPSEVPLQGKVYLREAQNYCRRIWDGAGRFHVPTRQELQTLVDYKRHNPATETSLLSGIKGEEYWTLTPSRSGGSSNYRNWVINFEDGRSYSRNADRSKANFLCVTDSLNRPDPPSQQYTDHGPYMEDHATGLFWHKQTTSAGGFKELADKCVQSSIGNKRWRVPTQKELLSLLNVEYHQPYIDPRFEGGTSLSSSTPILTQYGLNYHGVGFQGGTNIDATVRETRCVSQWTDNVGTDRIYRGSPYIGGTDCLRSNQLLQQFEAGMYKKIEGDLFIERTDITAVYLPYLEEVTGSIYINSNSKMHHIAMPFLTKIGGELSISNNDALDRLIFMRLAQVGGPFKLTRNKSLGISQDPMDGGSSPRPMDFRMLVSVKGDFEISHNPQLKAFSFGKLQDVGGFLHIDQNNQLWTFKFNRLSEIGSGCTNNNDFCGNLGLYLNGRLQYANFPLLESVFGSLVIQGNPKLEKLNERITVLNFELNVTDNSKLCEQHELDVIISRMWSVGRLPANVSMGRNKPTPGCRSRCPNLNNCQIIGIDGE